MSFTRPELLWLLLALPFFAALWLAAARGRRAALLRLGNPEAIASLTTPNIAPWRLAADILKFIAIALTLFALAGPRWGVGDPGVIQGRDLVITLDLSRSMLADDMRGPEGRQTRFEAARQSVRELVESIRRRGGHRVGLVVFASRPWNVCPLTTDYDHLLLRLEEFTPLAPPPEVNPPKGEQAPSGTRIGAAIVEAVNSHDLRFPGYQDVLLVSDGDDPAEDREREIQTGIAAALKAKIPIHVVGVGDPEQPSIFPVGRPDSDVQEIIVGPTKLFEAPLKQIANATGGAYQMAGRDPPNLDEFFRTKIEPQATRSLDEDVVPERRDRSAWFLLPAFVLLVVGWRIEP